MPIAIEGVQADVTMLNRAFNDISPAHVVYTNQVNEASGGEAAIIAFAIKLGKSYPLTDMALATRVLANMGLLPNTDLLLGVADYFAANSGARGLVVLQIARILTQQESATGFMGQFAKAALAWNNEVLYSYFASSAVSDFVPGQIDPSEGMAAAAATLASNSLKQALVATSAAADAVNGLRTATVRTGEALTDAAQKVALAKSVGDEALGAANAFIHAAAATLYTTLDDDLALKTRADTLVQQAIAQDAASLLQALAPGFMLGLPQSESVQLAGWDSATVPVVSVVGVDNWRGADCY
ncbi:MAG: hypothetical protein CFE44_15690 [Burkholderiales bacterium PBB4]|nr:MAG: hypothetical protein CFE44_15690 [Burkholderiales bacterium PBB4]